MSSILVENLLPKNVIMKMQVEDSVKLCIHKLCPKNTIPYYKTTMLWSLLMNKRAEQVETQTIPTMCVGKKLYFTEDFRNIKERLANLLQTRKGQDSRY